LLSQTTVLHFAKHMQRPKIAQLAYRRVFLDWYNKYLLMALWQAEAQI